MSTSGLLELHAISQKILISGMYINKGYINVSYSFFYIIVVSISIHSNLQFYAVFFFSNQRSSLNLMTLVLTIHILVSAKT